MSITSFYFLLFYALVLLIYYIVPKKGQWVILLLASILYYLFSDNGFLIFYPLAAVLVCHAGIRRMVWIHEYADALKERGKSPERMRRAALIGVIVVLSVLLDVFLRGGKPRRHKANKCENAGMAAA